MISNEEEILQEIEDLSNLILEELEEISEGKSSRSKNQLNLIYAELMSMKNNEINIISYPRVIIDSWDYSDVLGMRLIKIAQKYTKKLPCK